MKQLLIFIKL